MKRFSSSADTPCDVIWPPSHLVGSVRQTRAPAIAAARAAATPPMPAPTTTTSHAVRGTRAGATALTTAAIASPNAGTASGSSRRYSDAAATVASRTKGASRIRLLAAAAPGCARFRHRLARQQVGARRRVVHEPRQDGGRLLEVVGLQPVERVHVGMVAARAVLERVLDELEPGQAD